MRIRIRVLVFRPVSWQIAARLATGGAMFCQAVRPRHPSDSPRRDQGGAMRFFELHFDGEAEIVRGSHQDAFFWDPSDDSAAVKSLDRC
jgi:hypothetical protein